MHLSKRLLALAEMVSEGNALADIGCDHGYIPIYLVQNRRIPRAIAMDIVDGPLKRARENIMAYGLTGYIETRRSDGLEELRPGEADTILISGMGGPLMEQILTKGREALKNVRELILQPQSDVEHFRRFITGLGYVIDQENMIYEDGKFYPIMRAVEGRHSYGMLEYRYGPVLLRKHHPVLQIFLQKKQIALEDLQKELKGQGSTKAKARGVEIGKELQLVQAALKTYESQ